MEQDGSVVSTDSMTGCESSFIQYKLSTKFPGAKSALKNILQSKRSSRLLTPINCFWSQTIQCFLYHLAIAAEGWRDIYIKVIVRGYHVYQDTYLRLHLWRAREKLGMIPLLSLLYNQMLMSLLYA